MHVARQCVPRARTAHSIRPTGDERCARALFYNNTLRKVSLPGSADAVVAVRCACMKYEPRALARASSEQRHTVNALARANCEKRHRQKLQVWWHVHDGHSTICTIPPCTLLSLSLRECSKTFARTHFLIANRIVLPVFRSASVARCVCVCACSNAIQIVTHITRAA